MTLQNQPVTVLPAGWVSPSKNVERVARAIARAAGFDPDRVYSYTYSQLTRDVADRRPAWMHHIKEARAAIAEIGKFGDA